MQAFLYILFSYILFIYSIHQLRYSTFYIRYERLFLEKKELATRMIKARNFFMVISLEHFIVNAWLFLALMQSDFIVMAVFFLFMYHSTFLFRKIIPYYALAWWLDKATVIVGIILLTLDYYGFYYFRNLDWNHIILFSICFFLITFTTYFLKQSYSYESTYKQRIRQRISQFFKRFYFTNNTRID